MSKILVVEDDMTQQYVMRVVLDSFKFNADIVPSGEKALERLVENHGYALILMDIRLTGMDGFECTQAIRESNRDDVSQIPIIAVTAYAGAEDRKQCIDCGMNDYLSKPFELAALKTMIEKYLGREIETCQNIDSTDAASPYNQAGVFEPLQGNRPSFDEPHSREQKC